MIFETTTPARVFTQRLITVRVRIEYEVVDRGFPIIQDVELRVAGEELRWRDVPYYVRENWRQQMVAGWHAKYGLMLQKVTA
jgi:hypothetical protein